MRRDQLYSMTNATKFTRPVICAAAGFHHHHRRWLLGHEPAELFARQLLAILHLASHSCSVQLDDIFRQIHADHDSLRHGCRPFHPVAVDATILAHSDAVRGGRQPPHLLWQKFGWRGSDAMSTLGATSRWRPG